MCGANSSNQHPGCSNCDSAANAQSAAGEKQASCSQTREAVLTDYAKSLIRFKARQLARRTGFSRSDQEDLEQDLWLSLLDKANQFDPKRASLDTFIDRVVNTSIRMILRERNRQKRAHGFRAASLGGTISQKGGRPEPLGATLGEADRCRHTGRVPNDDVARKESDDAVDHALDVMPEDLRDVCRRVMGGSIASAARELGTSRRQIRNALAESRPWLERAGFGDS